MDFEPAYNRDNEMEIRAFKEEHLIEIVKFQNGLAPARRHMDASLLRDSLMDSARAHGKNVGLAVKNSVLCGLLAWVEGKDGEFFGSPFIASNKLAAQVLVDFLIGKAEGKNWVRVSAFPEEQDKAKALADRGFHPIFEFIEFETQTAGIREAELPAQITHLDVRTVSAAEFARLHNEAFAGVDNSMPIDEEEAKEILASSLLDPNLSRIWRNQAGKALAFSLGNVDGYLDAIGVAPSAQGQGIGTQLYAWILSQASRQGLKRVFTTVSSRNEGSLRLHRRLGIAEVERRTVWEKKLPEHRAQS